ncbi:hypothetical protein GLX30_30390 [Streptomyces sp. Tu 2975]|uniref:hypothetical protein n=1 Tax=Streptomyces sp. Tu 2975 TaxID=2676871 RepID=UPI00135B24BC|nr:hypothetical protein [Streptomyces sp. Tu 2975]QIP87624.1 hypothetical protein GLX30_30390 [Streptomyces sp. Tu 2975]
MTHQPHPFVITADGTDVDWTHPDTCPAGDTCPIAIRADQLTLDDMAALAEGRPDGTYQLSLYGFHGLCLTDDHGHLLADAA